MVEKRFAYIGNLKEQQKRCVKCHSSMYQIYDRKLFVDAKVGKGQDIRRLSSTIKNSGLVKNSHEDDFCNVKKHVEVTKLGSPGVQQNISKFYKKHLQAPELKSILLECSSCGYFCYVYEKSSVV